MSFVERHAAHLHDAVHLCHHRLAQPRVAAGRAASRRAPGAGATSTAIHGQHGRPGGRRRPGSGLRRLPEAASKGAGEGQTHAPNKRAPNRDGARRDTGRRERRMQRGREVWAEEAGPTGARGVTRTHTQSHTTAVGVTAPAADARRVGAAAILDPRVGERRSGTRRTRRRGARARGERGGRWPRGGAQRAGRQPKKHWTNTVARPRCHSTRSSGCTGWWAGVRVTEPTAHGLGLPTAKLTLVQSRHVTETEQ